MPETAMEQNNARVEIDPRRFGAAIEAIRAVVGQEHAVIDGPDLEAISKATIPDPKRPAGVVFPADARQVAQVVKIAGDHGIALWPVSTGLNWGYGSSTPALDNTVVLSLRRLDRIIEVNADLAYAVIEPGVTYRQLRAHLEAHHPALWCDSTDGPPDGSVIGNALDRGLGVTHYADHFGALCGLEVVLASGEVLRTGGGPPDCRTWHTHKWGVGPYIEGLFSQSNFGVVTKAGVWLMPRPEAFVSFTFDLGRPEDLPKLVDAVRKLALEGVLQSASHIINDVVALSVLSQYPAHLLEQHSRLPDSVLAAMKRRYGIGAWSYGGGIQGTALHVRAAKRELRRRLGPLGKLIFLDDWAVRRIEALIRWRRRPQLARLIDWAVRALTGKSPEMLEAAPQVHSVLKGRPSDYFVRHAYFKSPLPKPEFAHPDRDDCGIVWFAPIAPMTGRHIEDVLGLCRPLFERFAFDFYAALLVQNARSMIVLMSIFFMKSDPGQERRARELYKELGRVTSAAGYQQYRMGTGGMESLGKSAPDFIRVVGVLRRALDPLNILAPGKYGIR